MNGASAADRTTSSRNTAGSAPGLMYAPSTSSWARSSVCSFARSAPGCPRHSRSTSPRRPEPLRPARLPARRAHALRWHRTAAATSRRFPQARARATPSEHPRARRSGRPRHAGQRPGEQSRSVSQAPVPHPKVCLLMSFSHSIIDGAGCGAGSRVAANSALQPHSSMALMARDLAGFSTRERSSFVGARCRADARFGPPAIRTEHPVLAAKRRCEQSTGISE